MANNELLLQGEKRNLIILNDGSENYNAFIRWILNLHHFSHSEKDIAFFFSDDKYIAQCSLKARKLGLTVS